MPPGLPRSGLIVTALSLMASIIGCSSAAEPMGTLKGKVTFNDKPVADVRILVQSSETGKAASADVDSNGNYVFDEPLPTGNYTVVVDPIDKEPVAGEGDPDAPPPIRNDVPEKYRTGGSAGLSVEVKEEPTTFDIKMTN